MSLSRGAKAVRSLCTRSEEHTSELQSHIGISYAVFCFKKFFFNDTATTEIYTLSLHDALPISRKNEGMEPTQKQYPVVDVTGDRTTAHSGGAAAGGSGTPRLPLTTCIET